MTKKTKKEERRRKKMFLMIFMVLFVGIVLTASTYAWFTTNRNVQVNSIDVNVAASDGLLISVDAEHWGPTVTVADLIGNNSNWAGNANQLPGADGTNVPLQPVSTDGTILKVKAEGSEEMVNSGRLRMFRGNVVANEANGTFTLGSSASTESRRTDGGDFVAFDIFLQSTKSQKLYLAQGSGVTVRTQNTDTGIKNAARVAFLVQGSVAQGSTAASAQALIGATSSWIWEPNFEMHTAAGYDNARNTYHVDAGTFTANADRSSYTTTAALPYRGLIAEIPEDDLQSLDSTSETYFSKEPVSTHTSPSTGIPKGNIEFITLNEGITKVRVYMWFEGQDVDCEDKASNGQVALDLKFSLDGPEESA